MQVKKQVMIDAIDKALSDFDAQQKKYDAEVVRWKERHQESYVTEVLGGRWKEIRDKLTQHIRNGKPILREDMEGLLEPKGWSSSLDPKLFFEPDKAVPRELNGIRAPYPIDDYQLHSLRAALDGLAEDVVTHTHLAQLGFKKVEWVFRMSVINGGGSAT